MLEVEGGVPSVVVVLGTGAGSLAGATAAIGVDSAFVPTGPFVVEGGLVVEVAAVVLDWGGLLCFDETGEIVFDVSLLGEVGEVTP